VVGALAHRELAFRTFAKCRLRVTLLDGPNPFRHYGGLVDRLIFADITDLPQHPAIRERVRRLHAEDPIDGVVSLSATGVLLASLIAADLGLFGLAPDVARAACNKHEVRRRLSRAGIPTPWYRAFRTPDELRALVRERGLPLILKPVDGAGSVGVTLLEDPDDIDVALAAALQWSELELFLVEEVLSGTEVSVEVASRRGGHFVAAVTDKRVQLIRGDFVEMGHTMPSGLAPAQRRAASEQALAALDAVGVGSGVSHVEVMLTRDGPRVVEVNARIAGGLIPDMVELAGGTNLYEWLAAQAVGRPTPALVAAGARCAGVRFIAPEPGVVGALPPYQAMIDALGGVTDFHLRTIAGQTIPDLPGNFRRWGHVLAVADDRQELERRLAAALAACTPAPAPGPGPAPGPALGE
jgi:biotin carboxylase